MVIGQFKVSKFLKEEEAGKEFYLEIDANQDGTPKEIVLRTGDKLFIKDPEKHYNDLVERVGVDVNEAQQRLSRIPEFVKFIATASIKKRG